MTETTSIAIAEPGNFQPLPAALATIDIEIRQFEFDWRKAQALSRSRMVPPHFQGKPEDCMVAVMMARQLGINDLLVLQNVQVISGRPGFSASFAIGLANQRGPFRGPITWKSKGTGDNLEVTAMATIATTGEVVQVPVNMATAKAEGWTKNPKYRTMPEQMLRYRAATWLIRLHCPEVLLGLHTDVEVETLPNAQIKTVVVKEEVPTGHNIVNDLNKQIREATSTQVIEPPVGSDSVAEEIAQKPGIDDDAAPAAATLVDDPFQ